MEQRVRFYVDGFNFFYGLKANAWKRYYWLDVVKLLGHFVKDTQRLDHVYYFTAIPRDEGERDRQDLFLSANRPNPNFSTVLGKFLKKRIRGVDGQVFHTYEEKETDVNIAVRLIRDCVLGECDVSILVSGDSDLVPAIKVIRELKPVHKIHVISPPREFPLILQSLADANFELGRYESRFRSSVLPDELVHPNGYVIRRPSNWI